MDNQPLVDIEELLELDPGSLKHDTELASLSQWDSLAVVSFLALADSNYGVNVAPAQVRQCKSVGDLAALLVKG
jgi:acyl carrier protein